MLPTGSGKHSIFILEDDACYRSILENICSTFGETTAVDNIDSAIHDLTSRTYDLLLLDWHLIANRKWSLFLISEMDHFQPNAERLALFSALDLPNVLTALKSGFRDILHVADDKSVLEQKIRTFLEGMASKECLYSNLGNVANSLSEKAFYQNTKLFQAKRDFTRVFLEQILGQKKSQKRKIAAFVDVSPKTLERYLNPENLS